MSIMCMFCISVQASNLIQGEALLYNTYKKQGHKSELTLIKNSVKVCCLTFPDM